MPTDNPGMVLYSSSTFIDPIEVSVTVFEIFDIKAIVSIGTMVKISSTFGLADMRLSDFMHQKR